MCTKTKLVNILSHILHCYPQVSPCSNRKIAKHNASNNIPVIVELIICNANPCKMFSNI